MSVLCISYDNPKHIHNFFSDAAIGVDSDYIENQFEEIIIDNERSISFGQQRAKEVFQELNNIYEDCSKPNWDGYGAEPVDLDTYRESMRFIECLPQNILCPEVTPEPDGEISFEWFKNNQRIFSVSVGRNGELSYAGIYGISKAHGTEFLGDELPKIIIENIQRVFE
ncbi:hypothetical protein GF337_02205 [candidate division KSB1 bacterium]|nr:hypothetical protein [candidate division KSB1 bacterium]